MSFPRFDIRQLLDPAVYPWPVEKVELIETHISWVLLAGERVVKLKRPVDLEFVDFRDPASRKQACLDEVRLNRRLTIDVYLGVVPITANGVDAPGAPLEWATLMRRMPSDRMLDQLLRVGKAPKNLADLLADRLIPFHTPSSRPKRRDLSVADAGACGEASQLYRNFVSGEPNERDSSDSLGMTRGAHGETGCPTDPNVYLSVLTANLDQVGEAGRDILGAGQLAMVADSMRCFLESERDWLRSRFPEWLREGHGDLRCEHICLEPEALQIYDCVEFEIAIRCADLASDLAFLLMDLRRLGAAAVADELLDRYRAAGFDLPQPIVDLYAAHRALVRAKVAALERSGSDPERDLRFAFEAVGYLDLATSYVTPIAPLLVLVSGLSGSGKSTVAAAIARATGGTVLASDRVRKELAGMEVSESGAAGWHQGIYSDDWTARTYDRLLEQVTTELDRFQTVIVDATFLDNDQRERFAGAARLRGMPAAIVWTELDDTVARVRIEQRVRDGGSPSDATFSIRERQRAQLRETPLRVPDGVLAATIDTSRDGPASLDPFFATLEDAGLIGTLQREQASSHA